MVVLGRSIMGIGALVSLAGLVLFIAGLEYEWAGSGLMLTGLGYLFQRGGVTPEAKEAHAYALEFGWHVLPDGHAGSAFPSKAYPIAIQARRQGLIAGTWADRHAYRMLLGEAFAVEAIVVSKPLPLLQVVPLVLAKRAARGSTTDLVTGDAEFDQAWRVWCPQPDFARALLSEEVRRAFAHAALESQGNPVGYTIDGARFMAWQEFRHASVEAAARNLDALTAIADAVPAYVWREYALVPGEALSPAAAAVDKRPAVAGLSGGVAPGLIVPKRGGSSAAWVDVPGSAWRDAPAPTRDRNAWGRIALLLAFTFLLSPVGLVLAIAALRACRNGTANNVSTVRAAIIANAGMLGLTFLMVAAAIITG